MNKLLLTLILLTGCASTAHIDTNKCIEVANVPQKNRAKSGYDLYKECLDQQYQKNESKKGFWEKSVEDLVFSVLDRIVS
jgi:hypothetical protein